MKIDNTQVYNFEYALRGMRNPKNSWNRSDSRFGLDMVGGSIETTLFVYVVRCWENSNYKIGIEDDIENWLIKNSEIKRQGGCLEYAYIGPNDMKLAQTLIKAGPEHAKFLRQIMVTVDLTLPLYIWKEVDTYKVGTVANSTSTMHKLDSKKIELSDFEIDDYDTDAILCNDESDHINMPNEIIHWLEQLRLQFKETEDKRYWKELIRWLPESYLQTRTVTLNYAVLRNMYFQRRNHKLSEWHKICEWIESLPYAQQLITLEK